jgi:hypothetical protein
MDLGRGYAGKLSLDVADTERGSCEAQKNRHSDGFFQEAVFSFFHQPTNHLVQVLCHGPQRPPKSGVDWLTRSRLTGVPRYEVQRCVTVLRDGFFS